MEEQVAWRWEQRNGYEMLVVQTEQGREIPCSIPMMGRQLVLIEMQPTSVTSSTSLSASGHLTAQLVFAPAQVAALRDLLNAIEAHLYEMKILPEVADEEGHA